ncbi:MAG: hypothetical protein SFW09_08540 [Hyphomicrobiaceae bacterium]|nr:hypothetical protein [Hyphomicrobiaceae bacterium]
MQQQSEHDSIGRAGPTQSTRDENRESGLFGARERSVAAHLSTSAAESTAGARSASLPEEVGRYVKEYPLLAVAGATTVGLAVALALMPSRRIGRRYDSKPVKVVRDLERRITREMRSLRNSDTADQISSGVSRVLSSIDIPALIAGSQSYIDGLRRYFR